VKGGGDARGEVGCLGGELEKTGMKFNVGNRNEIPPFLQRTSKVRKKSKKESLREG